MLDRNKETCSSDCDCDPSYMTIRRYRYRMKLTLMTEMRPLYVIGTLFSTRLSVAGKNAFLH